MSWDVAVEGVEMTVITIAMIEGKMSTDGSAAAVIHQNEVGGGVPLQPKAGSRAMIPAVAIAAVAAAALHTTARIVSKGIIGAK